MDVFNLRQQLIVDYRAYSESFIKVRDDRIRGYVERQLDSGALWPNPLIQLNPRFKPGNSIQELVEDGILHPLCADIFRFGKGPDDPIGVSARLHTHQSEAVRAAQTGDNYVLVTGTGSGKSLAYIIPIVNYALKNKKKKGIKATIIYPMNALANSQLGELEKFLGYGFPEPPVTFARYTGQEGDEERNRIKADPPDILLTNYVMLEYILTRPDDRPLVEHMRGMQFLVLDELHTYRGRQGADVSLLVRRVRDLAQNPKMQVVGTSATLAGAEEGAPTPSFAEQQVSVARVATKIFGAEVKPERIIGETLTRTTPDRDLDDPAFVSELRQRLQPGVEPPYDRERFIADPLSGWIETVFGLETEPETGRLRRAMPVSVEEAAAQLAEQTGVDEARCAEAIRQTLMAGYKLEGEPVFAFRLHQFISRGDVVYASLQEPDERHISLSGQKFAPGGRDRVMLPLVFCRECGQEYYVVTRTLHEGQPRFDERDLGDQAKDSDTEQRGFLYRNPDNPWLHNDQEWVLDHVPDAWVMETSKGRRLTQTGKRKQPRAVRVNALGEESGPGEEGMLFHFVPTPFNFCLHCGVSYHHTLRSDFTKLSSLSAGGRSTATTVLALSALRTMHQQEYLEEKARKLLSFTDNRQDASLQAGHTNDFVEVGLLRSALYRAVAQAGDGGLEHDLLPQKVFDALDLPFELYAADPTIKYGRDDVDKALREVLGYRIYQDLRRGWRLTAPNLEQSGLLQIDYKYLDDICGDEEEWQDCHPALATASAATRAAIARTLMDYLRRELAIKVDFLNPAYQEQIGYRSDQQLTEPWAIDEAERRSMTNAKVAFPCTQTAVTGARRFDNIYVSEYGGFGYYLRRGNTLPDYHQKLSMAETERMIREIFERLRRASLVEAVREADIGQGQKLPGYQARAASFIWKAGDGMTPFHDPIRVPREPEGGSVSNPFFVEFYRQVAQRLTRVRAREHTAQVPVEERIRREEAFREGRLPLLYCSPTMELGVDIAQLNVVNMRNVPPTPANYAQRSGRAGRSGQPALVFTYCTTGSPHDQYHFRRPERMVSGQVSTPRLDLANRDLLRAHLHAIWLAETGVSLGKSLRDVLDIEQDPEKLPVQISVLTQLKSEMALVRARKRAERILTTIEEELDGASWYKEGWLEQEMKASRLIEAFEAACERWRGLFRSAREQQRVQNKIVRDPSRPERDRRIAAGLRQEAEKQLSLLTDESSVYRGDFYSYRYFASEGFLPGYNFPRLPLSAYIPARQGKMGTSEEFLNRPRFLAISEFGPRSIIYHEGSKYVINKVILPVGETDGETTVLTTTAKLCPHCGYLHVVDAEHNADVCDRCGSGLAAGILTDLFRMENVATKRRDRISSDEEERLRQGYDIVTGVRFSEHGRGERTATVEDSGGEVLWQMAYGDTATLWRINRGWSRRENPNAYGFWLDTERGYWQRNTADISDQDEEDPMSDTLKRVIPYVEDHKNALLLQPAANLQVEVIASLQAALQKAIQVLYQLEDNELAVEPLPSLNERRLILMYEASEGGAGVLRQLLDKPQAMAEVAREALRLCHFDPITGEDLSGMQNEEEPCEIACYDCLLSYYNQMDHRILDRHLIRDHLLALAASKVESSPVAISRAEHLRQLKNLSNSELEREWLDLLEEHNLRLPDKAQHLIESCGVRPDFFYDSNGIRVAIFIDGPHHDSPEQKTKDAKDDEKLEWTAGIESIRFHYLADWEEIIRERSDIFVSLE